MWPAHGAFHSYLLLHGQQETLSSVLKQSNYSHGNFNCNPIIFTNSTHIQGRGNFQGIYTTGRDFGSLLRILLPTSLAQCLWLSNICVWHEFKQTLGDSEGQGSLVCCSPWGSKESDTTEQLNNNSNMYVCMKVFWKIWSTIKGKVLSGKSKKRPTTLRQTHNERETHMERETYWETHTHWETYTYRDRHTHTR